MNTTSQICLLTTAATAGLLLMGGCKEAPSNGPPTAAAVIINPARIKAAAADIDLNQPNDSRPLSAGAALSSSSVKPGEHVAIVVKINLAPTWHIYAVEGTPFEKEPELGTAPTALNLSLPPGVEALGQWQTPGVIHDKEFGGGYYEGELLFHRILRLGDQVPDGPIKIKCDLIYQACNDNTCLPKKQTALTAAVSVGE